MDHKKLELALLIALCDEWLAHYSHAQIGSDPTKIRLMKRFASESDVSDTALPDTIRDLYREVFSRDFDSVRNSTELG